MVVGFKKILDTHALDCGALTNSPAGFTSISDKDFHTTGYRIVVNHCIRPGRKAVRKAGRRK